MTVRSEQGRTVWVRLVDVPLTTRLYHARVLRERELAGIGDVRSSLTALERALDLDRAARNPSPLAGLEVPLEKARRIREGRLVA